MSKFLSFATALILSSTLNAQHLNGQSDAEKNNEFGFSLYKSFSSKAADVNFVFSPATVYLAAAALYDAAEGDCAAAIKTSMNFPQKDAHEKGLKTFVENFYKLSASGAGKLKAFGVLWQGGEANPEFVRSAKSNFATICGRANFANPQMAAAQMNGNVANFTGGIKNSMHEAFLKDARLAVQSIASFDGFWAKGFSKKDSYSSGFFVGGKDRREVSMMSSESVEFNFVDAGTYKAIMIPYRGNSAAMILLSPSNGAKPTAVLNSINASKFRQMLKMLKDEKAAKASLSMPRFHLNMPPFSASEFLRKSALAGAFAANADFSRFAPSLKGVPVDAFVLKTEFKVEENTLSAAKENVDDGFFGMPVRHENVERPFAFIVADTASGAIYFMGHVVDPTKN